MTDLLASIPSPSTGTIGPLHAYGLMIALGVLAAAWLMGRRLEHDRIGVRDDAYSVAMWAVPAGVVGARLYHVVTQWEDFKNDLPSILKIWQGGLAHRAREVSRAKTSLLRVVVSERVSSANASASSDSARPIETRNIRS